MIEISLGKLVLLALIALIVLGPEKLPGAARTAGALLRRARNGWDNVRAEVERELEIEEIKRAAREVVARADAAQAELKDSLQRVADITAAAPTFDAPPADAEPAPVAESDSPQAELPLHDVPAPSPATEPTHDRA